MTIDEMQEILKDLEKQHTDATQLSLKIVGAVELVQKMIEQDEEKIKDEEATTVDMNEVVEAEVIEDKK